MSCTPPEANVVRHDTESSNDCSVDKSIKAHSEQHSSSDDSLDEFCNHFMESTATRNTQEPSGAEEAPQESQAIEPNHGKREKRLSLMDECLHGRHAASLANAFPPAVVRHSPPTKKRCRSTSRQSCHCSIVNLTDEHAVDICETCSLIESMARTLHEEECGTSSGDDWIVQYYNQFLDITENVEIPSPPQEAYNEEEECLKSKHAESLAQALPSDKAIVIEKAPRMKRLVEDSDEIEFVDKTESDVLFGRGGESNHHVGNVAYRAVIEEYRPHYRELTNKQHKTDMAKEVVEFIQRDLGGRFLEWDSMQHQWYVVHDREASRKVGQALRDKRRIQHRSHT